MSRPLGARIVIVPPQGQKAKLIFKLRLPMLIGDKLYRMIVDGLLLRYLGRQEWILVMAKVHEGICGADQAKIKMKWLLR